MCSARQVFVIAMLHIYQITRYEIDTKNNYESETKLATRVCE
jgi:hypothetical protein